MPKKSKTFSLGETEGFQNHNESGLQKEFNDFIHFLKIHARSFVKNSTSKQSFIHKFEVEAQCIRRLTLSRKMLLGEASFRLTQMRRRLEKEVGV